MSTVPNPEGVGALIATARARIQAEADALTAVGDGLDETFVEAVRLIRSAPGKVLTVGVGTSGPIARRMAHLLATCGTPAIYLHPADALHGGLGAVQAGDVIIPVSKGGNSKELNDFISLTKSRGAKVLVLTAKPDSPLGQLGDVTIRIPQTEYADPGGVVAMGSSLATAVWGDALAIVLMQITGYAWDAVLGAHPAGAVGQISELPDRLPRLPDPSTTLSEEART